MGFFKSKQHQPHLTEADKKRLAEIDSNPALENRKCRYGLTLKHPDYTAELFIVVYGKDLAVIKEQAANQLKFFKSADPKWIIDNIKDLKSHEDQED